MTDEKHSVNMKLDLVMWTLNGGETLEQSLSSMAKAIPEEQVCHRIMVDGGSHDNTKNLAQEFGWEFLPSKKGIASQANYGLSKVDTALFGSFEQDILLSNAWLPRMQNMIEKPGVAVAQGLRVPTGSKPVEAMSRWMFEEHEVSLSTVSIDNDLCRTNVIRAVGGYPAPNDNLSWPDGLLWNKVLDYGYQWLIDAGCISGHLRPSFWGHVEHEAGFARRRIWEYYDEPRFNRYARLFFSPVRGAEIAGRYHAPSAALAYPLFRYLLFLSTLAAPKHRFVRGRFGPVVRNRKTRFSLLTLA